MHPVTIERTLACGDTQLMLASDDKRRSFVGFSAQNDERFVFLQVDRVTLRELEEGSVDLTALQAERCAGLVFETTAEQAARLLLDGAG